MIYIGSDHGGFRLKQAIKDFLKKNNYKFEDLGCYSSEPCDYPDYAVKVAAAVKNEKDASGILICGTGIGMCMTANKVKGIRAALCHDEYTAEMSRAHNDANVLCMGGRVLREDEAIRIVKVWLETPFSGEERHERRISKMSLLEKEGLKRIAKKE